MTKLDVVNLQKLAQQQVESSPLWKRFIDGTPLSNDISVWMCNFVIEQMKGSAKPVGVPEQLIGEMRENGVTWFGQNPHAFPIGTRFYAIAASKEVSRG